MARNLPILSVLISITAGAVALAACSSGGGSAHIQCGPALQCPSDQTCWIPGSGDTSQAQCLPAGSYPSTNGGWNELDCTDRSACAADQVCCNHSNCGSGCGELLNSDCETATKCLSENTPSETDNYIWCSSNDECTPPQTCVPVHDEPWLKSCQ